MKKKIFKDQKLKKQVSLLFTISNYFSCFINRDYFINFKYT